MSAVEMDVQTADTTATAGRREWGEWHGDKLEYARLPLVVITNAALSAAAVRAYAYMIAVIGRPVPTNSDGKWHLTKRNILNQARLTEHTWRKVVRELEAAGLYLGERPDPEDREGGRLCWVHHLYPPAPPAEPAGPTTRRISTRGAATRCDSTRGVAATLDRDTSARGTETERHTPARARSGRVCRFADFWAVYPRRQGEAPAKRVWQRMGLDDIADRLIADVRARSAGDYRWRAGYAPNASNYLADERWRDAIEAGRATKAQGDDDVHFRLAI